MTQHSKLKLTPISDYLGSRAVICSGLAAATWAAEPFPASLGGNRAEMGGADSWGGTGKALPATPPLATTTASQNP